MPCWISSLLPPPDCQDLVSKEAECQREIAGDRCAVPGGFHVPPELPLPPDFREAEILHVLVFYLIAHRALPLSLCKTKLFLIIVVDRVALGRATACGG